jgi:hypothetical protein
VRFNGKFLRLTGKFLRIKDLNGRLLEKPKGQITEMTGMTNKTEL